MNPGDKVVLAPGIHERQPYLRPGLENSVGDAPWTVHSVQGERIVLACKRPGSLTYVHQRCFAPYMEPTT